MLEEQGKGLSRQPEYGGIETGHPRGDQVAFPGGGGHELQTVDGQDAERRQLTAKEIGVDHRALGMRAAGRWALQPGQGRRILDVEPQSLLGSRLEHARLDRGGLSRIAVSQDEHARCFGCGLHGHGGRIEPKATALLAAYNAVQVVARLAAKDQRCGFLGGRRADA